MRAPQPVAERRPGEEPGLGPVMGRQLRRALLTVGVVVLLLGGLPVLALWLPARTWVVISVAVQPVWVLLAVLQLRSAERLER